MIQPLFNGMIAILLTKFVINDLPHAAGLDTNPLGLTDRPTWYIKSKPPSEPYLYHHALYSGLKRIAVRWAIEAPAGKNTISLTTDAGRYLSPLPILTGFMATVDGVVKMPLTEELQMVAIPALYRTRDQEQVDKARDLGFAVYAIDEVPPEYKYIMDLMVHHSMFVTENEYTVIAKHVDVPIGSIIYIDPKKLKRFKAGLPKLAMADIRSLEELAK